MKIDYCSDLHLEFGPVELPGGDVLILAGDIAETKEVYKSYHSTRATPYVPGFDKYYDFFENECQKYNKVFYVFGNHEHYGTRVDKSFTMMSEVLPKHITVLENSAEEYNGILFVGGTMWTDMNKNNEIAMWACRQEVNDYKKIQYKRDGSYGKLNPRDVVTLHTKTVKFFMETLSNTASQCVVISHHAPTLKSIPSKYVNDILNAAYASDVSDVILDNPHVKYWVHGHIHDAVDYEVGDCRVISNPRGYYGYESFASSFTVKSFEV